MDRYRFASVQLDGGLQQVATKVETQFRELHTALAQRMPNAVRETANLGELRVGIMAGTAVTEALQRTVGLLCQAICSSGGTVVLAGDLHGARVLQVRLGKKVGGVL